MLILVRMQALTVGRSQVRGEVEMHEFRSEARSREEARDETPRSGAHPGLLLQLTWSGEVGVLDRPVIGHVKRPGRDLEQGLADRDAVLAHEQDPILVVDSQDRDGTGVTGDLARPAGAVGALDGVHPERQIATLVEDPRIDDTLDEIGPGGIPRGRWVSA